MLVVEFGGPAQHSGGILARHGHVAAPDVIALLREAGLEIAGAGPVGFGDLQFVLAVTPKAA